MAKRFELHLEGMGAPEGLIDADRLVEIVRSLQEMATRLGRIETDSANTGRPNKSLDRVASLRIGLEKGSTTIVAERAVAPAGLPLDLADEEAVDRRFAEVIEGIGSDHRPEWVNDSIAATADDLVAALQRTAPRVEFKVDGVSRKTFETQAIHRETWKTTRSVLSEREVSFTGRLFAVNLNTHRLQVQDDVGNQVGLPQVSNDAEVSGLIGRYVTVTGAPERDTEGRLTHIHGAAVLAAPDPLGGGGLAPAASLEEILASAPGVEPWEIAGLTEAESDSFFEAMGL